MCGACWEERNSELPNAYSNIRQWRLSCVKKRLHIFVKEFRKLVRRILRLGIEAGMHKARAPRPRFQILYGCAKYLRVLSIALASLHPPGS